MRIQKLSLVVALTISALTSFSPIDALARGKEVSMGCTVDELRLPKAVQCIDMTTKPGGTVHHVECSGGVISCCNDEPDSGGRPAGFCIDIKKNVQTKRPKVMQPLEQTAQ